MTRTLKINNKIFTIEEVSSRQDPIEDCIRNMVKCIIEQTGFSEGQYSN